MQHGMSLEGHFDMEVKVKHQERESLGWLWVL